MVKLSPGVGISLCHFPAVALGCLNEYVNIGIVHVNAHCPPRNGLAPAPLCVSFAIVAKLMSGKSRWVGRIIPWQAMDKARIQFGLGVLAPAVQQLFGLFAPVA